MAMFFEKFEVTDATALDTSQKSFQRNELLYYWFIKYAILHSIDFRI